MRMNRETGEETVICSAAEGNEFGFAIYGMDFYEYYGTGSGIQ